jgi:hypothetical protein
MKKHPNATLKEARGKHPKKPERMYRNVLGTKFANKNEDTASITLMGWTLEPMDKTDLANFERLFEELLVKMVNGLYPNGHYNIGDYWGSPIAREEYNEPQDYESDYINRWKFEIDGVEQRTGELYHV